MCKHNLRSGCAYCHKGAIASLNGSMANTAARKRQSRAQRYAVKLDQAMNQTGPLWRAVALREPYTPISRSHARWIMNQYGGN